MMPPVLSSTCGDWPAGRLPEGWTSRPPFPLHLSASAGMHNCIATAEVDRGSNPGSEKELLLVLPSLEVGAVGCTDVHISYHLFSFSLYLMLLKFRDDTLQTRATERGGSIDDCCCVCTHMGEICTNTLGECRWSVTSLHHVGLAGASSTVTHIERRPTVVSSDVKTCSPRLRDSCSIVRWRSITLGLRSQECIEWHLCDHMLSIDVTVILRQVSDDPYKCSSGQKCV